MITLSDIAVQFGKRVLYKDVNMKFTNGNIYWSASTGAHYILRGGIFDAWGAKGYEQGEYGWPTTDQARIAAGGETITFQNGTIRQVNGRIEESR